MDAAGQAAVPYVLQFSTRQEPPSDVATKPQPRDARPVDHANTSLDKSEKVALPAVEFPPTDLKYRTDGSDEDAKALIGSMLKANAPWIEPKPAKGTYSLLREADATKERLGPFSVSIGCKQAVRIGSFLYTPLHSMAKKKYALYSAYGGKGGVEK